MFTPLIGYPTKWGNKNCETFDWVPPNPYVVGGVSFPASALGFGGIDSGYGGVSQSGNYRNEIRMTGDGAQQTCKIMVFVVATGLEAAAIDLSAEKFRTTLILV